MTRSEKLKNQFLTVFPQASTYWGFDNPFNINKLPVIYDWFLPPEIPVLSPDKRITIQMECRTSRSDFPSYLSQLETLGIVAFDIKETMLPAGSLGIDNVEGYLYKFKITWEPLDLS